MRNVLIFVGASCLSMAGTTHAWMEAPDYASVSIIVSETADKQTEEAAQLFAEYWEKCAGHSVERTPAPRDAGLNVWIGAQGVPAAWAERFALSTLKWDGVVVETLSEGPRKDLVLAGGPGRGTVYSVYEFFERAFGVRWIAPGVVRIPGAPDRLEALHVRHETPFVYRVTHLPDGANPDEYRIASKFVYGFRGHSLYDILPPQEYFAEHPEYYSELKGKRVAPADLDWKMTGFGGEYPDVAGQLCMTNPATAEAIAKVLAEKIRKNPAINVQSVSQMDWGGYCTCETCRALDEAEGSPAASMITGVNRVAEIIEKEFPGTYIQTYAYTWTRKPPKTIRPRHNVIIQLCTFECDFARTLDNPESNVNTQFMEDLRGWQKLGANILFYDYPNNCDMLPKPYPNFHVMGPNMRIFAKSGGIGVFEQCTAGRLCALGHLRPYVLSKLMWNPELDADAVIDEFLAEYYGQAAPYIREYIDLSRDVLVASEMPMYIFDICAWITPDYVRKSEELFKKAREAAETDAIRERVDLAYFSVQYSGFLSRPEIQMNDDTLLASYPVSLSKAELRQRLQDLGLEAIWPGDWPTIKTMFDRLPECTSSEPLHIPLVKIENDRYALWAAPKLTGSILRWQDKTTGTEWLKGYETAGVTRGTWQDWVDRNTNGEGPAAQEYAVVEQSARRAVFETKTDDGLKVRRVMEFPEGDGPLEVVLSMANESDVPIEGRIKSHPEFNCQQPRVVPEIWLKQDEKWTRSKAPSEGTLAADFLKAAPPLEWAFYVPEKKLGIQCNVAECDVAQLLYFYDTSPGVEQVNLELMPTRGMLEPGQSRALRATYEVITAQPE